MPTPDELERQFWKSLSSDMTMMVGLKSYDDVHPRPLTAQLEEEGRGPIWFFTAKDTELAEELSGIEQALFTFASKDHDVFATVHGRLSLSNDRDMIERLWNRYVAAWFEGGKDDPNLALLRFDAEHAEIWLDETSLFAGIKMLLGADPKKEYQDKTAEVTLKEAH